MNQSEKENLERLKDFCKKALIEIDQAINDDRFVGMSIENQPFVKGCNEKGYIEYEPGDCIIYSFTVKTK